MLTDLLVDESRISAQVAYTFSPATIYQFEILKCRPLVATEKTEA
jgi:hypothetical protein